MRSKMVHFAFQYGAFCTLKRCVLQRKTATFAVQKWQFWNAKVAVLECDFGELISHSP